MLFRAEQVTVGRIDVGPDQDGPATLKDFVVGSDADAAQVDGRVLDACPLDGFLENVADGGVGHGIVEDVAEKFADAAEGTVADEQQREGRLLDPRGRDREGEQNVAVRLGSGESAVEGVPRRVDLPGDEFAADAVVAGGLADGVVSAENRQNQVAALRGLQQPSGAGARCGGVDKLNHACSLP